MNFFLDLSRKKCHQVATILLNAFSVSVQMVEVNEYHLVRIKSQLCYNFL